MTNRRQKSGNSGRFYFLGFPNYCGWWQQPWNSKTFAPWKESYDKPRQHMKKQRYHFANRGPYSQSHVFPVVMYGCESWIIKKAEHLRIDAFKLCCWRRLLRVPWTARRSNQSILKKNPEYSREGLKLKLQPFGYLMRRANSLEKMLVLGNTEGRRKGWQDEMLG